MGEFLVANGLLDANPTKLLTMPKKDAAIRMTVIDSDVSALFDACERQRNPRQIALSRAVLSVLCYGGCAVRNVAICALKT